jgi:hypothetical protein
MLSIFLPKTGILCGQNACYCSIISRTSCSINHSNQRTINTFNEELTMTKRASRSKSYVQSLWRSYDLARLLGELLLLADSWPSCTFCKSLLSIGYIGLLRHFYRERQTWVTFLESLLSETFYRDLFESRSANDFRTRSESRQVWQLEWIFSRCYIIQTKGGIVYVEFTNCRQRHSNLWDRNL